MLQESVNASVIASEDANATIHLW